MSVTRSVSRYVGARVRRLSFEGRLTLVAAVMVTPLIVVATVVIYLVVQSDQVSKVDDSLRSQAVNTSFQPRGRLGPITGLSVPQPADGRPQDYYYQILGSDGNAVPTISPDLAIRELPVNDQDRQVASGAQTESAHDGYLQGVHVRILTRQVSGDSTLQVATSLTGVDSRLTTLRFLLVLAVAGGIALAAGLGRVIAQTALGPIYRLRQAVDHVAETSDMSQRVPDEGRDELALLGAHFNRMLGTLDQSLRMQRQLVADASHELRTPLASMRTNIEVLQRAPGLVGAERDRLLKDVLSQLQQLTNLIQDLIDLARGDQAPEEREEVRLDWVVATAVQRAATNWPAITFRTDLAESLVVGQASRLDRAVSNLLDNAGKWSPPGGVVDVWVTGQELIVRDHGPGIDRADLPYVFDRFWRAPAARGMPGSGLGLSIVRQVAEAHGGTVAAELPPDGGTLVRLTLNGS